MANELLKITAVTKTFGGLTAVNQVDMTLYEGQVLGLIGPNGAGKTTLFNCISGLLPITSGTITFKNEVITNLRQPEIARKGISRTFQQLRTFRNLSVLDNVLVGAHTQGTSGVIGALLQSPRVKKEENQLKQKAMGYLELLGMEDKAEIEVKNLSYGDQRRVEIARALASEPDLILLDEPAAGLNLREAQDLTDFIRWIRDELKKTILLIEHNMRVVMPIADHVVVLNQGRKICEGEATMVQNAPEVIEAYLGQEYMRRKNIRSQNVAN